MKRVLIKRIFCFLIFLEIFFWIGSLVSQELQFCSNFLSARKKDVYRIMCIGESTTQLGGQYSYPSQLEGILNAKLDRKKFQVINQGMGGAQISALLEQLPKWLQTYHPDMVIAMMGILDPLEENKDISSGWEEAFIKKIKLYQVFTKLRDKVILDLEEYYIKQRKQFVSSGEDKKEALSGYEQLINLMKDQSASQNYFNFLMKSAEESGRYEIAESLYEQFLRQNKNGAIQGWVIKEYGNLLIKMEKYEKFVSVMERIPYDSWTLDWVKGYCHSDHNMEHVRLVIEKMVQNGISPLVYGYIGACYEEGGRGDLKDAYLDKMDKIRGNYFSSMTQKDYLAVKDIILSQGIKPVFIQYPMRGIRPLLSIFENDPDKSKIVFVDNEEVFKDAVQKEPYETYFVDRAFGDFGHATPRGNRLLAENVARIILEKFNN